MGQQAKGISHVRACALGVFVAATLLATGEACAAPLPLYVLAGQSNMVGWGQVSELPEEVSHSQTNVLYHTDGAGFGYLRATDDDFGPELEFGRTMSAGLRRQLAILKYAVGSTSLAYSWNPDLSGNLYTQLLNRVTKARTYWATEGFDVHVAGIVWMQGEEDARRANMAPFYEANLRNFAEQLRIDLAAPRAPFVYGQIRAVGFPYRDAVRGAQYAVDAAGQDAYLVETDDLTTYEGLHFDTAAQLTLGRRFGTAMLGARSAMPGDANGDGIVGVSDLNAVRNNFGAFGEGDTDQDGLIGISDLNAVRNHFGSRTSGSPVPEPTSLVIAALASLALAAARLKATARQR